MTCLKSSIYEHPFHLYRRLLCLLYLPISPSAKSVVESPRPEPSFTESVASPEPLSIELTAASSPPWPSVAEPTVASVVQWGMDPRRKRSHSKEEEKHSK
ncbi:hypothetical protein NPIL_91321 [Nephila pilipes]|uniref:Uncharacterized protein n=1 Tax=Nephila pilipes TaxID=299642 RepID=A0A8X6NWG0_NEPPI|nr:hypothetical protein NPIL_91321 [Nephila pilipes]